MTKFKLIGATALSLALAFATPAMARGGGHHGGGGGFHGGGFHGAGGFRGAQASVRGFHGGGFAGRGGDYHHGYSRGLGFAGGLLVGSALGYGYGGYYGDDYYPGDYYADNGYYGAGQPYVVANGPVADPGYCAQRYKSYDPASGTYLGYDGLRHPCE
jgi:hypothetical protein